MQAVLAHYSHLIIISIKLL